MHGGGDRGDAKGGLDDGTPSLFAGTVLITDLAAKEDGDEGGENQEYDMKKIPEHGCRYCGVHNPASVVKCNTCSKWFCNGRGMPLVGRFHQFHACCSQATLLGRTSSTTWCAPSTRR